MPSTTPVTLIPGTLPEDYCYPPDPQTLNVDIVTRIVAFLNQTYPGIYVGPTSNPPPADQRDRVWFNTDNQKLYWYINGAWQREYEIPVSSDVEWIWKGTEASLVTFAGGEAGAVGTYTGPLWEVDHLIDGRALVGAGTIPTSSPPIVLAQGDTGGEAAHVLTESEGAVGQHLHGFGKTNAGNDDAFFRKSGNNTVPAYTGYYITGSDGNIEQSLTDSDLYTLPSGLTAAGVTSSAHNTLQPYIARFVIKRTARQFVKPPY